MTKREAPINLIFCKINIYHFTKMVNIGPRNRFKPAAPSDLTGFHFDEPQAHCYHSTVATCHLP